MASRSWRAVGAGTFALSQARTRARSASSSGVYERSMRSPPARMLPGRGSRDQRGAAVARAAATIDSPAARRQGARVSAAPSTLRIALVQMRCAIDPAENLATASARVREAARRGAGVVCLPELFRSPYFCQREAAACFALAEPVPGPTTEALGRIARETRTAIIAPVFERRAAGVYHNTAAILDADGTLRGRYRKMHIPDDPLFYEKF